MKENRAVVELNLEDILPNRFQPRIKFDEKAIIELSESIKEHGVIQPIIVRKIGDKYEIIAGERRYKASVMAGKISIPAIVVELNDKDSSEIALIENVQRQDLTPIEEAISYRKILDMGYLTQEELANKLGVAQPTIANKLRLLNLDEEVQDALLEERISERHARSLLKLSKSSMQREMLKRIITERLTVRKTDEEIDKMMKEKDNSSVFDSIESNMMNNNSLNNNEQVNTVNSSNPFDLTNQINNNFEINNQLNSNLEENNVMNNVPLNQQINNIQESEPTTDFNNISSVPTNNFDMDNNMNSDIEVIDFNDFMTEDYNIPTVPIVEDVNEVDNQAKTEEPVEQTFNMPTFENNEVVKEDITPITPSFNIENNNVSSEINNTESQLETALPNQMPIQENIENEIEQEPELRPGRFFNLFNTYSDEETTGDTKENDNDFVNNPFGLPDQNTNDSFSINNPINEVENDQNNMDIFNQNLISNEVNHNETLFEQTQENNIENIQTPNISQNFVNNFDYNSQPVQPVYDETINTSTVVEQQIEETKEYTLKDIINMIRNCANDIEKLDFEIDCEEFDFDDIYQVIFKIKKK